MPRIGFILPTYSQFNYARRCLESLGRDEYTADNAIVLAIDDASPDWRANWFDGAGGDLPIENQRFQCNSGLTKAWNSGFARAVVNQCTHVIFGNSDVIVALGAVAEMMDVLKKYNLDVVGPLSNTPGVTNPTQMLTQWATVGKRSDDYDDIDATQHALSEYSGRIAYGAINGFFMLASVSSIQKFSPLPGCAFPPVIATMPSGRKNPWPTMTGQEDWLCARPGIKSAIALGAYVFHYRSASRGKQFAKGDWQRIAPKVGGIYRVDG